MKDFTDEELEVLNEQLKEEVSSFVDLHDWDNSIEAGALYTGFHMVNVIIDKLNKAIQ